MSVQLPAPLQRLSNRFSWFVGGVFLRQFVDKPINTLRLMDPAEYLTALEDILLRQFADIEVKRGLEIEKEIW